MTSTTVSSRSAAPGVEASVENLKLAAVTSAQGYAKSKSTSGIQVGNGFITRGDGVSHLSTLVGPRYDLPVYLVLLMLAKAPDKEGAHTVQLWPRELAPFVGLSKYEKPAKVARAMRDALERIQANGGLELSRTPGKSTAPRIRLLNWDLEQPGDYERPTSRYVTLPRGFWANGWHAALSSRALAMFLVSLHQEGLQQPGTSGTAERGGQPEPTPFWVTPRQADNWYGMHPDTRNRGWRELVEQKLLVMWRKPVDDVTAPTRFRNTYRINHERLNASPAILSVKSV